MNALNTPEVFAFLKARADWFNRGELAKPALDAALLALAGRGIDHEALVRSALDSEGS